MGFASGPIAVVLSFIAFGLIMAALGWTVALQSQRPGWKGVSRNTTECKSILVHVSDSPASERALDLACCLASDKRVDIILAYVIEVPLRYALNAPLPESEEKARGMLGLYALERLQGLLPLNPQGFSAVAPDLALKTALQGRVAFAST